MKVFKAPCFFIGLAILLSVFAVIIWIAGSRELKKGAAQGDGSGLESPVDPLVGGSATGQPNPVVDPGTSPQDLGLKLQSPDPELLINRIAKAFAEEDVDGFTRMLGSGAVDEKTKEQLRLMAQKHAGLHKALIREVGELEVNKRARWALEFDGEDGQRDRIYLDLMRGDDGKWSVEKLTVPSDSPDAAITDDALGAAEAFLQAVLSQKFVESQRFVDMKSVSNARIAGLCILFEEGDYHLRKNKPLRSMFQRQGVTGYIANVEAADGSQAAQFSLIVTEQSATKKWLVTEINLDKLLADYAKRVAGGDIYYSPLVKNPTGGDTLALYFEFDEDEVNPRIRKQLDIVSGLLKADPNKKLKLSGHTDAKGTDDYNVELSERRADVVRDYLVKSGVEAAQIVTVAKGSSQPRRPNVTESGEDNPDGRRANRRTEIYLDF